MHRQSQPLQAETEEPGWIAKKGSMDMEYEKIRSIIAEEMELDVENVKPDSKFVEDLGADSLDIIQIVIKIEKEFDIEIPEDAIENIATVQDAVDQIQTIVR